MASKATAAIAQLPPLPVWATAWETYRRLWRHRWVYLGQLFIWSMFAWLIPIPTRPLWAPIYRMELDWSLGTLLNLIEVVLPQLAGGGLMFLSCGRAILYDRRPRISDAVRIFRPGTFWRCLAVYWLLVNLVPDIAFFWVYPYLLIADVDPAWHNYYAWRAGNWAWGLATAPLMVLALPIGAFEASAGALREGWRRSRGNRVRLAMIALAAAGPTVALGIFLNRGVEPTWRFLLATEKPFPLSLWPLNLLWEPIIATMPTFLCILVLGAVTTCAYIRLSPRFEHVARVFD